VIVVKTGRLSLRRSALMTALLLVGCSGADPVAQTRANGARTPPQAAMTLSSARVAPGDVVTADASLSTGPGPLSYSFDWGDGDASASFDATMTHVYDALGTYTVRVTVINAAGNAIATAPIAVWSTAAPIAQFSMDDPNGLLPGDPLVVDASASTAANGIVSYTFAATGGETRTQTSAIATFTFSQTGLHFVDVTVTDRAGNTATESVVFDVGLKCAPKVRVPTEGPTLSRTGEHLARDAAGTIYATWFDGGGLAFSRSLDGGKTFEPQTTIVGASGPFEVGILGSSLAVSDDGVVHIAWTWSEGDFGYVRSVDGGATFSPIVLFDPVQDSISYDPVIATSGTDRVAVSWVQSAPGPSEPASSPVAASSDAGRTYSVGATLPADDFINCGPSIAYDGSTLVAAWHASDPSDFGSVHLIQVAISNDDGATFSAPVTLDAEQFTFCPSVVAQHGHIGVFWVAGSIVEKQRIMLSISDDHGATFRAPVATTPSFAKANAAHVTFDDAGNVYVAYADNTVGEQLEFLASSDGGRTFGPPLAPTVVIPNSDCAAVNALAPGQLEMLWSEPRLDGSGVYEVYYTTATITLP
jgi:PKD repeat protein